MRVGHAHGYRHGGVRREARGGQRGVPAARRDARAHDRAAAAAPTRCRGASCRGSTPAAGTRRNTRARCCPRSRPSPAGRARMASRATSRSSRCRAASARPVRRWRSTPRRCGATPRCRRCCRRSPRHRSTAARDAAPAAAARAARWMSCPADWLERLRALECVALDAEHTVLTPTSSTRRTAAGTRACCYTPNDPLRVARARAMGRRHDHHRRGRPDRGRCVPAVPRRRHGRTLDLALVDRQVDAGPRRCPARSTGTTRCRSCRSCRRACRPATRPGSCRSGGEKNVKPDSIAR